MMIITFRHADYKWTLAEPASDQPLKLSCNFQFLLKIFINKLSKKLDSPIFLRILWGTSKSTLSVVSLSNQPRVSHVPDFMVSGLNPPLVIRLSTLIVLSKAQQMISSFWCFWFSIAQVYYEQKHSSSYIDWEDSQNFATQPLVSSHLRNDRRKNSILKSVTNFYSSQHFFSYVNGSPCFNFGLGEGKVS